MLNGMSEFETGFFYIILVYFFGLIIVSFISSIYDDWKKSIPVYTDEELRRAISGNDSQSCTKGEEKK